MKNFEIKADLYRNRRLKAFKKAMLHLKNDRFSLRQKQEHRGELDEINEIA